MRDRARRSTTSPPRSRPREAEAASAFGDGTVFVEPYVERGRHVEVQVVGDGHGDVLVLGERDCSIQRRHQKVVEEAPAPDLAAEVAARAARRRPRGRRGDRLRGAGTVEFLYDPDTERFFFLEMNTRLQVEHPVTEAVYGVDLVELQIAVAEGGALLGRASRRRGPRGPRDRGAALRRGPGADYQPQSGRLIAFEIATTWRSSRRERGIRVDSGFESGDEVGTHYDAMLAKVIA